MVHRAEPGWAGGLYTGLVDVAAFIPNIDVCADGQLLSVDEINVVNKYDAGLARNGTQLDLYRHALDGLTSYETAQRPRGGHAGTPEGNLIAATC